MKVKTIASVRIQVMNDKGEITEDSVTAYTSEKEYDLDQPQIMLAVAKKNSLIGLSNRFFTRDAKDPNP